jgi:mannose-6-phosphate isomerase-like protein (cupin superfamily)
MGYAAYPPDRYRGDAGEPSGRLRRADVPPELDRPNTRAHYLATGETTGGDFGLYRWEMNDQRQGPGPHFHRSISESFYVLSGRPEVYDGRRWLATGPGDFLHVPPGGVHGFRNESGAPASMLILFTPGAPREDYFERVHTAGAMGEDEREEFYRRHDTFWV